MEPIRARFRSRRSFLGAAGAAAAGAALLPNDVVAAPLVLRRAAPAPAQSRSNNGFRGVAKAVDMMTKGADRSMPGWKA